MLINKKFIKSQKLVGYTTSRKPIILIETHGGLFAFFVKKDDETYETLATASHPAIGMFLCEKKDPSLKWVFEPAVLAKSNKPFYITQKLKEYRMHIFSFCRFLKQRS